ncbi:uncharacterized protein EHS24_008110 [Apiotrichum porosum]|uniref:Cytochrome c oxidase subunit VIIc n=1 Tax=Apiotrichum porosum TaxID=105984 RepID=A0A427XSX5_9TREE|nr:uncharacterized protein EHS24_008110 [Apiotrichum porosum]RSH81913.1 hypothetical protein EHS24_008110 [Apiotrichum porosum]
MAMLLRANPLRAVARAPIRQQVRALHIENTVDNAIPAGSGRSTAFKLRFIAYGTVGTLLPYIAAYISFQKAAAA